jgi:flagellar FliL protein
MSTVTAPDAETLADAAPEEGGGRKKRLLVVVALVLVLGAAGWWFFIKPDGPEEPVAGEVLVLDPIQVNLADGHYLRIGVALQLTADAEHADGSKALDAVIELFSGVDQAELVKAGQRKELKHHLEEELHHSYHGEVMEVYFTEFVTQ